MEPLILQELHRNTTVLVEALNVAQQQLSQQQHQQLSAHPLLRRPLRNLDRSLGRYETFCNEQQQQSRSNPTLSQLLVENDGNEEDETSIVLGAMPHHPCHHAQQQPQQQQHSQPSTAAASQTTPTQQQQQQQQEASMVEELYQITRHDLWTILIRLPPTDDAVCVSILRRTVLFWGHLTTDAMPPSFANFETLWQLIGHFMPDCLFTVQGMVWVRVANQLRSMSSSNSSNHDDEAAASIVVAPTRLAYHTLRAVLPTIQTELQSRVDTTIATTNNTTSFTKDNETAQFVQELLQFLAFVLHDLVTAQTLASQISWQDWWTLVTENSQPQQEVVYWMDQLVNYLTLLVDYAQDELDQACAGLATKSQEEGSSSSLELTLSLLSAAVETSLVAFVSVQHLQAWQNHYPALDCQRRLHILWETLAQVNLSPGASTATVVYETCYLPTLVSMTQRLLTVSSSSLDDVNLSTFIGVWLRLVPYPHLWVHVEEIWSFLEQQKQESSSSNHDDETTATTWPVMRRLIQLVLLTMSSASACAATAEQVQVRVRLQELVSGTNSDTGSQGEGGSMADMYFAGNYQPVGPM